MVLRNQQTDTLTFLYVVFLDANHLGSALPAASKIRRKRSVRIHINLLKKLQKSCEICNFTAFRGGPKGIRTLDLSDANRTLSQTVHLYAPKTTRKSTLIHRILSQKFGKCMWHRFFLRLKLSTNRLKKLSYIITRILLGCQLNGRNTVRIPLWKC